MWIYLCFCFSSRRRHTRYIGDWSSDVCSSDLVVVALRGAAALRERQLLAERQQHEPHLRPGRALRLHEEHRRARGMAALQQRSEERRVGEESRTARERREKRKAERYAIE